MYHTAFRTILFLLALSLFAACANVIPPTGGKKDTTPPKLLSIKPGDSSLNTRVTRIDMKFDEFVTVSDVNKELRISPTLKQNPTMTASGKTVSIKIPDSLLQENTTYTIQFGKAIKDLHEANPYSGRTYRFSTGAWFDSLKMRGTIMDAATGKTDSTGLVSILLYDAKLPFDVVTKQKPAYVVNTNNKGSFLLEGLPQKAFRIFALKETGDNLQFDNDDELIGFADTIYNPAIDTLPIKLSIFKEKPDSLRALATDNTKSDEKFGKRSKTNTAAPNAPTLDAKTFNYRVMVDSSNKEKRTLDINKALDIYISRKVQTLNPQRIFLSADSNGVEMERKFEAVLDSSKTKVSIITQWQQNSLYTIRLLKSFVQDSSAIDAMPSKYAFRTMSDDDYGKMDINIPERFVSKKYLLQVTRDADSVYRKSISSDKVSIKQLSPGSYKIIIIEDTNGDGSWTTGDLKKKRHAELVIPYNNTIMMKAGWEHVIDFEPKKK